MKDNSVWVLSWEVNVRRIFQWHCVLHCKWVYYVWLWLHVHESTCSSEWFECSTLLVLFCLSRPSSSHQNTASTCYTCCGNTVMQPTPLFPDFFPLSLSYSLLCVWISLLFFPPSGHIAVCFEWLHSHWPCCADGQLSQTGFLGRNPIHDQWGGWFRGHIRSACGEESRKLGIWKRPATFLLHRTVNPGSHLVFVKWYLQ